MFELGILNWNVCSYIVYLIDLNLIYNNVYMFQVGDERRPTDRDWDTSLYLQVVYNIFIQSKLCTFGSLNPLCVYIATDNH